MAAPIFVLKNAQTKKVNKAKNKIVPVGKNI